MDYEWAQVYVEIVIDAIAHDTLGIESGGVGGVDFLAVHLEGDFPATHHDAQLVHGLAGRIGLDDRVVVGPVDRKSTRLNSSHGYISYAVFCLKKKKKDRCTCMFRHFLTRSR